MSRPKMKWRRCLTGLLLGTAGSALVLLVISCSSANRALIVPPQIEGATFVGNKVCFDCHADIARVFPGSPHARLHSEDGQMAGHGGCESCHGPASKHVALGGRGGLDKFIVNPGKDPEACYQCHQEIRAEFHFPQHHPVTEGKMNCVQCHDPHGLDIMKPAGGLAMGRLNENCAQCHREQTKPVVFEHPALREGCITCHSPHGSINAKMLTVRDSNLCFRCHAQVPGPLVGQTFIGNINHTGFLKFGTCWTAGCHAGDHGSNTQPYLLY